MVASANKLATSLPTWKNIENAKSTTVITKLSNVSSIGSGAVESAIKQIGARIKIEAGTLERRECKSGAFKSLCLPQWFTRDKSVSGKLGCSRVERLLKRYKLTGNIQPRPQGRSQKSELNGYSSQLHELVKKYPDSTLSDYCEYWGNIYGQWIIPIL